MLLLHSFPFLMRFSAFIIKAQANVDALKAWKNTELPLLQALSSEITIQRENLIYHLGEEWKKLAVWKLPSTKGKCLTVIMLVMYFSF